MNNEQNKANRIAYEMTSLTFRIALIYFSLVLALGLAYSVYIMTKICSIEQQQIMSTTIEASLSIAAMMCSMQYIRRLYKACINGGIITPTSASSKVPSGILIYFLSRPFFSFVFVIVAIFAMLSGLLIITASVDFTINERFMYLCIMISSFIGFSTGRILDRFEEMSNKKIDNTFKKGQK